MSRKEVPRAGLVKAARAGKITNHEGAVALQLSVRQFQRLKRPESLFRCTSSPLFLGSKVRGDDSRYAVSAVDRSRKPNESPRSSEISVTVP